MQLILETKIILIIIFYLVFQPAYKYFELTSGKITSWESKGCLIKKLVFLPDLSVPNLKSLYMIMLG